MDTSFRTAYREQQTALAAAMLPLLMTRLRARSRQAVNEFLSIEISDTDEVDEEAYWIVVETDVSVALITAVRSCIDFWCTEVVRSRSYRRRAFDVWKTPETIEMLAAKANVKKSIIRFVFDRIRDQGGVIPPLGKLKIGRLTPDRASLAQWRELYDWTEQAKPAPAP